jgi:hypothetical protein
VKVRKGELSTVKMSVVPQVVLLLPGTSSSPREEDPSAIRRSPIPRPLLLVVALQSLRMRLSASRLRPPVIHTNWDIVNYSKEEPMTLMNLQNQPCYN